MDEFLWFTRGAGAIHDFDKQTTNKLMNEKTNIEVWSSYVDVIVQLV